MTALDLLRELVATWQQHHAKSSPISLVLADMDAAVSKAQRWLNEQEGEAVDAAQD
jgi:hypothetical protein